MFSKGPGEDSRTCKSKDCLPDRTETNPGKGGGKFYNSINCEL